MNSDEMNLHYISAFAYPVSLSRSTFLAPADLTWLKKCPARVQCAPKRPSLSMTSQPDVSVDNPSEINDGLFGQLAIQLFRRIMAKEIGWSSRRTGYDGFVEETRMLLAKAPVEEQQRVVFHTLNTLFQAPYGSSVFRRFFADKPQLNALITPIFFQWLVGPCATNVPEGYPKLHGVHIEKCRFLHESGCKGLCVNMCQQPTQRYFTDVLGLPLRMTPNYEDSSCQMIFGLHPLPIDEDPAVTGDCLKNCKMASAFAKRAGAEPNCYSTKEIKP